MSTPTWGLDPKARRITVYYESSDTIYEGMALCYNSDATDNWLGVSSTDFTTTASSITESGTTAEGSQNEGKFIRVEKPSNDNLQFFAGVVAGGDHTGESGPKAVDIYVPNGAIVPVRSSIYNYEGETVLGVQAGDYELQDAATYGTRTVPVALAMEDIDRGTTEGLCLAKLIDPCVFNWQAVGFTGTTAGSSQRLNVGNGVSSGNQIPIRHFFNNRQTGGGFNAMRIRVESLGGGENYNLGGCIRAELDINAAATTGQVIGAYLIFSDGATTAFTEGQAIEAKIEHADSGGAVLTGASLAVLHLNTLIYDSDPSELAMIRCQCGGDTGSPDYFLVADSEAAVAYTANTDTPTQSLKCKIGGNDRYIMVSEATS